MGGVVGFDAVKAAALDHIATLAPRLLPAGQRQGNWWVARCPWREDKHPSLAISLTTARYKDWGTGDGGTIIDLAMRLYRCEAAAARDILAGMLGLTPEQSPKRSSQFPPKAVWRSCTGCRWLWRRFDAADYCTRVTCHMTAEPQPIALARRDGWACGWAAKLYEAAARR